KTAESKLPVPQAKKKTTSTVSHVGCEGAYFQPTAIRSATPISSRGRVESARNVACHGQTLQHTTDDNNKLSSQYQQLGSSKSSTSRTGLIQALEFDEKTNEDGDDSFNLGQTSRFGPQKATFKKKIIVKKPGEIIESKTTNGAKNSQIKQKHYNHAENYLEEIKQALAKDGYRTFSKALRDYKEQGDYIKVTAVLADLFTSTPTYYHLFRKFYSFLRAKHKQEFDQLCKDITGEGAGYKPEDSISNKRLRQDHTDGPADKKAKTDNFNSAKLPSITANVITVSSNPSTSSAHLNTLSNCAFSETSTSSKDIIDPPSVTSSKSNSQSSSISTCSLDNNEKLTDDVVENVNKILTSSNKPCTGYTCSLCGNDSKVPFEALCQHTCCLTCWRQVLDGNKLCPGCGVRIRRRHLVQKLFASGPNLLQ
ncbi:regulator of telomere elongation helicase 1, partial [Patella vulgata]|uniref:regulator of telomere elongation helicase 1 n=1 Tax=Patella vulgata TaxID=6465 RepID=UPI00217FBC0D